MPDTVTLAVVVLVPSPHASVISRWRESVGDTFTRFPHPHVTLLTPLRVPATAMDEVERHLAAVAAVTAPFPMHLSGADTYRPAAPVAYVRVTTGAEACRRLAAEIRQGPLERELEFPYHAHVTIAQHVGDERLDEARAGLAGFVARFTVGGFALFERGIDGWAQRADFALGG